MEGQWSESLGRLTWGLRAQRKPEAPVGFSADHAAAFESLAALVDLVGAPLLGAIDEEELEALLDQCVERYDSVAGRELRLRVAKHAEVLFDEEEVASSPDYSVLPDETGTAMRRADRIWQYLIRIRQKWLDGVLTLDSSLVEEEAAMPSLEDPSIPPVLLQSLYLEYAGLCAGLAILAAMSGDDEPSAADWLLTALAQVRLNGALQTLRRVASMPGIGVPAAVVSEEDRIDWRRQQELCRERHRFLQELLDEAGASGRAIYPPFEEDEGRWPGPG